MKYFYISILVIFLNVIQASIYSSIKNNVLSLIQKKNGGSDAPVQPGPVGYFQQRKKEDARDKKAAQNKASVLKNIRTHGENLKTGRALPSSKLTESMDSKIGSKYFLMDPILNGLKRRSRQGPYRRKAKESASGDEESDDLDTKFWMEQWDEHWMQKKFEALNTTQPRGDVVNMVAARPWGVPCGDPNQHDMPWGSCMLAMECDAEYRIYRGDYFCGRTHFVCCALLVTNYDMYQGLDVSFDDSSFSSDSFEKRQKGGGSEQNDKQKRKHERHKRKREREKRKREIKKSIKKIVLEIRKILNRAYRNGTTQRKRKTKDLKKFIEMLKNQYRKDRKSVVNVHEYEMVKIDTDLQARLDVISSVNQNFMVNDTFRDIIINGTLNKDKFQKFLRTYPDIAKILKEGTRRSNNDDAFPVPPFDKDDPEDKPEDKPGLEYDLEFGKLYY